MIALAGCGGDPNAPVADAAIDSGPADTDGGLLPFGATCQSGAECQSGVCFIGGNQSFCSLHCTAATVAIDCPVPPTSGICNKQGYCKHP